jgi:hypothetical protein
MLRVESRMGEMAQMSTPAGGYCAEESHATWQPRQRITVQRAGSVPAKPKKLSCRTCSGLRCIGRCRF